MAFGDVCGWEVGRKEGGRKCSARHAQGCWGFELGLGSLVFAVRKRPLVEAAASSLDFPRGRCEKLENRIIRRLGMMLIFLSALCLLFHWGDN